MRNRNHGRRAAFAVVMVAALATSTHAFGQSSTAFQWRRWEQSITSKKNYFANGAGNPYRHLVLVATFTNRANGAQFKRYGFWDGGSTFKIRAAFPTPVGSPGTTEIWDWTTSCTGSTANVSCSTGETPSSPSDTGLNRSGTVTVSQQTVGNDLYDRGYPDAFPWINIQTGEQRNLLWYGDRITPFLWIGDTAWEAPILASTTGDWTTFITNRKSKKFTSIMMGLAPDTSWVPTPNAFETVSGTCTPSSSNVPNSCSRWVPAYWRSVDDKVNVANDNGLLVVLVGLNDPLDQGTRNLGSKYPLTADAVVFARNLAARMGGSQVIFSPAFDDHKDTLDSSGTKQEVTLRAVAQATNPAYGISDPRTFRQLVTMHLAGGSNYSDYEAFSDIVHLHLFHSGHGKNNCLAGESEAQCALRRAQEMTLVLGHFLDTAPARAVCDSEALYESDLTSPVEPDTPNRVRQAAHMTTLSGGFGHTLGVGRTTSTVQGIFPWVNPLNFLESTSSKEMTYLRSLFFSRPWRDLVPQHCNPPTPRCGNLVRNQGTVPDQKMVVSVTTNSKLGIAYLPNNASIWLDTSRFSGLSNIDTRWSKQWWNPRTGLSTIVTSSKIVNHGTNVWEFLLPDNPCPAGGTFQAGSCDWVLVLQDTCSTCASAASSLSAAATLRVWQGRSAEGMEPGIFAQAVDPTGKALTDELQVSAKLDTFHKLPQVAHGRDGSSLVVWQSEHVDGGLWGIFGRVFDRFGRPLGEPFQVNTYTHHDQSDAAVAQVGNDFLVTWMSYGQDGDMGGIYSQRYGADGRRLGPEFQVNTTAVGHQGFPQVAADAAGNYVIAWESALPDGGLGILAQRFNNQGKPVGSELRLDAVMSPAAEMVSLTMDPLGEFSIEWQSFDSRVGDLGRFGRRFSSVGQPLGNVLSLLPPSGK